MKTKHVHEFKMGKSKKVSVCSCGVFRHENLKPEDVIEGVEAKHTPGPWIVIARDSSVKVQRDNHNPICDLEADHFSAKDERTLADAHLIAAAPDLLEACHLLFRELSEFCLERDSEALRAGRAAIAKAERGHCG